MQTTQTYSGTVNISVSGTVQASGCNYSHAFYVYADCCGNPLSPPMHYKLTYGWDLWINGQKNDTLASSTPAYSSNHTCSVPIYVPSGTITFAVGGTGTSHNGDFYAIAVT